MTINRGLAQPRIPFLLWGDLRCGDMPILRRKLVGWRAHECMYAWVYLTDYLAVRKIEEIWDHNYKASSSGPFFPTLGGELWTRHDRALIDPHFQINANSFETATICAAVLSAVNDQKFTISELGSTFFTSIDKFKLAVRELMRLDPAVGKINPAWCGIDNSPFVNQVAQILHPSGVDLKISDDHRKFRKANGYNFFVSRFVCSYVFEKTVVLGEFLNANFGSGIFEDAFAADGSEVEVFNHGQRETYLDIAALCRKLRADGRRVFLLDHYPDFPGGTVRCFVCKLMFVDDQVDMAVASQRIRQLGYEFSLESQLIDPDTILDRLNEPISADRWEQVRRYKTKEPVWGRTPS